MTGIPCKHCGSSNEATSIVCPSCGLLGPGVDGLECEFHAGIPAIACCAVCGKPLCGDCSAGNKGAFLCDAQDHRTIASGWAVAADCSSVFEADMITRNLLQGGIESMVFAWGDHVALFGFPALHSVHVRVPSKDLPRAGEILAGLGLDEVSRNERNPGVESL